MSEIYISGTKFAEKSGTSVALANSDVTIPSGVAFPSGHVIQTSTPTILTNSSAYSANATRLGSLDIWYHNDSKITNSITKQQGTSSFLLVHYTVTRRYIADSGAHSHVIFIDSSNYIANNDDFNRVNQAYSSGQHLPRLLSGSVPFLNMAAGSYTFTFGLARSSDSDIGIRRNYRANSDGLLDSECSSSMYIQEIAG